MLGWYSSVATSRTMRTSSNRHSGSRTIRCGSPGRSHTSRAPCVGAVPRDRELLLRQVRREDELSVDGRRPTGDPMTISARQLAELFGSPAPTDEQAAVIQAPLAPCVVIAGAGSGKTETMAARVVWLIANRMVAPDQVLGLTFTRKAAAELAGRVRHRLAQWRAIVEQTAHDDTGYLAQLLAGEPTVLTYSAYAGRLVGEHALRLGREPGPRLLSQSGAVAARGFGRAPLLVASCPSTSERWRP